MVPIAAASVFCLALILERMWALRREHVFPERFLQGVEALALEQKAPEVRALCRASDSPVARILEIGLAAEGKAKEDVRNWMEMAGRKEVGEMEKHLDFLAMLATVSPLLGLLGTVTGIIRAFLVVRVSGLEDPARLSGGIAEALICTAAGLVVAIPALVAHRFLVHRVDRFILEMEDFAERMFNQLKAG